MRRIYLDHNATTPVHPEVAEAVWPFFGCRFGNPSAGHSMGMDARRAVEEARGALAGFIGAAPDEVFFTSGGTEANNLAILGTAFQSRSRAGKIVTARTEHAAVLEPVRYLESLGFPVDYLPVDRAGRLDPAQLERVLAPDALLVSVMTANNETGVVQDIPALARISRRAGVPFHTDAVQAFGKMRLDVSFLDVDFLSISGHKAYAPKGVGALYIRRGRSLSPPCFGGGQELGVRSGTENVPGIVGLGKISRILDRDLDGETARLRGLCTLLRDRLVSEIPATVINGDSASCLCNTLSVSFPGVSGERLVDGLDDRGVCVSGGSACEAGCPGPSHVLTAMGLGAEFLESAIRISMGRDNTEEEVHLAADRVREVVEGLRRNSSRG